MNTEYTCECGKTFKSSSALNGHCANCQIHKDAKKKKDLALLKERESRRLPNGMFICENCGNEHDGSYGSGRFCSESCQAIFAATASAKSRKQTKANRIKSRAPYGTWKCDRCNLVFETKALLVNHNRAVHPVKNSSSWNKGLTKETNDCIAKAAKKTSKTLHEGYESGRLVQPEWTDDRRAKQSEYAKANKLGGYHKNGGRGKRGWYKGFWCDSSWELAWVIYNLEHGIHFVRNTKGFPYKFDGEMHEYHPDFLMDDGSYVEIKGWYDAKTNAKHQAFRELGYTLIVLNKTNIEKYLTYVQAKYGLNYIDLYETK